MASLSKKSQPAAASPNESSAKQPSLQTSMDDIQVVTSFFKSVVSSDGCRVLVDLVDKVSKLEVAVKNSELEVKKLQQNLELEKQTHANIQHDSLDTYTQKYKSFENEKRTLDAQISSLKTAVVEKERTMSELTSLKVQLENRAESMEKSSVELQSRFEAKKAESTRLAQQLKSSQGAVTIANHDLTAAQMEVNRLKGVEKSLKATQIELEHLQKFAVPFADCKLEQITRDITKLWSSLKDSVTKFVEVDLPSETLENGCKSLASNEVWQHGIPLPATNTAAAKSMRVAVVLGVVAWLFSKHIMQPTYLEDEGGYLNSLLVRLAVDDPERAIYLRRVLLNVLPKVQEENSDEKADDILEELKKTGVNLVIRPEDEAQFEDVIISLCEEMQTLWETVQKSSHTLEPVFDIAHSNYKQWYNLRLWSHPTKLDKKGQRDIPEADDWIIHSQVIIPQIWVMTAKPRGPGPVMPGAVLPESEAREARLELLNTSKAIGPTGRSFSTTKNAGATTRRRRDSVQTSPAPFLARGDELSGR